MAVHQTSMSITVLILLALSRLGLGDTSPNEFIYPGPSGPSNNFRANLKMPIGTSETIQWTTNTSNTYQLALFQQAIDPESGNPVQIICSGSNTAGRTTSCTWTVQLYNTNLSYSPVYFFWVNPGTGPLSFTSHYFNITDPAATTSLLSTSSTTASTSTLSSTTSASSSSSSLSTITSLTLSATPAAATTSSGTGGDNNSVALSVGLGVGLGIGIPLVLIAGILVGLKIVRQRQRPWHEHSNQPLGSLQRLQESNHQDPAVFTGFAQPGSKFAQEQFVEVHEAPAQEPGWGPDGRYEAGSKTPRLAEM